MWVIAPLAAAAVTNVLTVLSAVLVGQTRQFKPAWWTPKLFRKKRPAVSADEEQAR